MVGDRMLGRTATDIAAAVRAGDVAPRDVVAAHLDRIDERDGVLHAFRSVRQAEGRMQLGTG